MARVRVNHCAIAEQIETDVRRDLLLVCGRTIGTYLLPWLTPLVRLYAVARLYWRRIRS
jgi:hypothetical protein